MAVVPEACDVTESKKIKVASRMLLLIAQIETLKESEITILFRFC